MKSPVIAWVVRLALFAAAFVAPGVGFAIRSAQTGNAELAIDGLGWGVLAAVVAVVAFALTFRVSGVGRLGRGVAFLVAILVMWAAVVAVLKWLPA